MYLQAVPFLTHVQNQVPPLEYSEACGGYQHSTILSLGMYLNLQGVPKLVTLIWSSGQTEPKVMAGTDHKKPRFDISVWPLLE